MSNYWRNRQAEHIQRAMEIAEASSQELAKLYQKSCYYFNEQIQGVFDKYRKKHSLSEAEAKALLNDLTDPTSYDQMLKRLKAGAKGEERKELLKELEAPAYQYRINKLQESQKNLDIMMREVYKREKEVNTLTYIDVAYDSYFNSIYNLHERTSIAFSFENIDPEVTDKLLNSKWSGKNYSERIWDNTQNLADLVKEEMLMGVLTGKSEKQMTDTVMEKFAAGAYNSRRLICTESDFISNALDMEAYREADIDMIRFCAVHDMKTSPICQRHDRSTVPLDKAVQGVNVPPLHPNCRSSTEPVINKAIEAKMKRRVRDPITGKNKIVSANQNYQEWLRNQQKEHGKDTVETFRKKVKNINSDRKQYQNYINIIGDENMPESLGKFQDMKYNNTNEWSLLKKYKKSRGTGRISAFSSFDDYKKYYQIIQDDVIGLTTPDGIKIKSQSDHFIERVLGTIEKEGPDKNKKREGVKIDDVISSITKPLSTTEKAGPKGRSRKYIGENIEVTINPDTGNLIQTNPKKRK